MEYVIRFLLGVLVTFIGCEIAILIMRGRIVDYRLQLKRYRESLTEPEAYVWVRVDAYRPKQDGEYLVEYVFDDRSSSPRFYAVYSYSTLDERFDHEGFRGSKILRWAELPK